MNNKNKALSILEHANWIVKNIHSMCSVDRKDAIENTFVKRFDVKDLPDDFKDYELKNYNDAVSKQYFYITNVPGFELEDERRVMVEGIFMSEIEKRDFILNQLLN